MPEGWATCSNDVDGYSVSYPGDWHTTDVLYGEREPYRACRYFAREPFDPDLGLELNDEGLTYPIHIYTLTGEVETIVESSVEVRGVEVVSQTDMMVAGLPAVRLEITRTQPGCAQPVGAYYSYFVEVLGGRTFEFITAERVDETHCEDNMAVLDRLVGTLTISG